MDRGRKRAILRSTNAGVAATVVNNVTKPPVITLADIEVKNGVFVGRPVVPSEGSTKSSKESQRKIEAGGSFCFKNKSLQEINELCGGGGIGGSDEQIYGRESKAVHPMNVKRSTEVQTVAIDFRGSSRRNSHNSHDSIYNDLREESRYNNTANKPASRNMRSREASLSPSNSHVIQKPIRKGLSQRSETSSVDIYGGSKSSYTPNGARTASGDRRNQNYEPQMSGKRQDTSAERKPAHLHSKPREQEIRSSNKMAMNFRQEIIEDSQPKREHYQQTKVNVSDASQRLNISDPVLISSHPATNLNASIVELDSLPLNTSARASSGIKRTTYNEMPSLVTFKTYSDEPSNPYLETSFDTTDPNSVTHSLESSKSNVSRTSLNFDRVTMAKPAINSQTYKMEKDGGMGRKKGGESIVIRIPASEEENPEDAYFYPLKQHLNKQVSNDSALDVNEEDFEKISSNIVSEETSLNGKFTFEIYKELQRTRDRKLQGAISKESLLKGGYEEKSMESYESHKMSKDSSPRRTLFLSSEENTLDESFRTLSMDDKVANNNFYFEEQDLTVYDEVDVISPDSSIPYPLRVKINPFTQQKEPYSVNLGRVWKQLNLGQDDLSLDASTTATQPSQTNVKIKNESFKSMSSRDSGFSLTLTKPKNIFGRKPVKKPRRKTKVMLGRDGYLKKVVQQDSTRRKKKRSPKPPALLMADGLLDQSFYETFGRYYKNRRYSANGRSSDPDADDCDEDAFADHDGVARDFKDNEIFLQEFQEFCMRRRRQQQQQLASKNPTATSNEPPSASAIQSSPYLLKNFNKLLRYENADVDDENFTQEISDLEAFFEEHLKRLKEYYMQKKKLAEQTSSQTSEIVGELGTKVTPDDYQQGTYFMAANDTLKRKQKIKNKQKLMKQQSDSSRSQDNIDDRTSLEFDFAFPHPDKRVTVSNSKKKNKFQTQEVREFSRDSLKYASLEFHGKSHLVSPRSYEDFVPYADLKFPTQEPVDFPYGKIKSAESRRITRHKFKKSFETRESLGSASPAQSVAPKIHLSSIFPSVWKADESRERMEESEGEWRNGNSPRSTTEREVCQICLKEQQELKAIENDYCNEDDPDYDDDDEEYASDEFSENEFIANSLGGELCLVCDKMHSECLCSLDTADMSEQPTDVRRMKKSGSNLCYCDCTSAVYTSTLSNSHFNKRKIKRIKSRRRLGKNHSTLRRGYNYYPSKFC